ncbi:hypothetical protein [Streptosporangium sp. NPDC006007]|uniref:hypothetical protein n=1 Tax=Streptosporangium sp. NPDC006007 TaxID=3154575 RepID=UPI0033AB019D
MFDMAEAELFAAEDAPSMPPQSRPSAVFDGGSFPRDAVPTTQGRVDDALVESLFVALADSAPRVFDRKWPPGDRFIRKVPDGDDMERRAVTQILTTLTAGAAIPMDALEILRSGLGRVLGATDDLAVEDWERTAYDHACALRVMSPAALIGYLSADIAELQHALDRRPDLDRVRMRRVGAQFAALMAMALSETGDFLTASRWWRIARRTADASGDRELSIWTLGRQALVAQTIGMSTLALRLLRDVEQLTDDRPSCGLAEALTTRAKIDGLQDAESARRALDELRDLFERLPVDVTGERAAIWGYPEERLLSVRTGVLTAIGDADVHDDLASEIARYGQVDQRSRVRAELKMGWYLVNTGEVRDGLNAAGSAMADLPAGHRTTAVTRMAARVYASLPARARTLPAARELRVLTTAVTGRPDPCRTVSPDDARAPGTGGEVGRSRAV